MAKPAKNSEGADQRVALVVGGVRGLGLAAARALAGAGWRVHVTWRSSRTAAAELEGEFGLQRADFTSAGEARAAVAGVLEEEGRLDGLVHTVGPYLHGRLDQVGADEVAALHAGNVVTAARAMDASRESLRAGGGSVVLFGCSGLAGLRAKRDSAAYTAAKSALLVLARSWAVEEAPFGVRVNMISPGIVPHAQAHESAFDERLLARIPMGRAGRPEEIGEAVRWLLSDGASYVTGADLPVAGGYQL